MMRSHSFDCVYVFYIFYVYDNILQSIKYVNAFASYGARPIAARPLLHALQLQALYP